MRNAASSAASALSGAVGGVAALTVEDAAVLDDRCRDGRRFAVQLDDRIMEDGLGERREADLGRDLLEQVGVLAQEVTDVLATLTEAHVSVREPGAALVDDVRIDAHVEHAAGVRDALVVEDVELGGTERWCDLVLDNLDLDAAADDIETLLDRVDLADVHA